MSSTDRTQEVRSALPIFGPAAAGPATLHVDGLVATPLALSVRSLQTLASVVLVDDFTCLEGWTVRAVRWQGVPLGAVLDLAQVQPAAQWVQASAGDGDGLFSLPVPLAHARRAFIAYGLDGRTLSPEHGGPLRLVVPGRECFTSIKWLDHLRLLAEPGPDTARAIATGRLNRPSSGGDATTNQGVPIP